MFVQYRCGLFLYSQIKEDLEDWHVKIILQVDAPVTTLKKIISIVSTSNNLHLKSAF